MGPRELLTNFIEIPWLGVGGLSRKKVSNCQNNQTGLLGHFMGWAPWVVAMWLGASMFSHEHTQDPSTKTSEKCKLEEQLWNIIWLSLLFGASLSVAVTIRSICHWEGTTEFPWHLHVLAHGQQSTLGLFSSTSWSHLLAHTGLTFPDGSTRLMGYWGPTPQSDHISGLASLMVSPMVLTPFMSFFETLPLSWDNSVQLSWIWVTLLCS